MAGLSGLLQAGVGVGWGWRGFPAADVIVVRVECEQSVVLFSLAAENQGTQDWRYSQHDSREDGSQLEHTTRLSLQGSMGRASGLFHTEGGKEGGNSRKWDIWAIETGLTVMLLGCQPKGLCRRLSRMTSNAISAAAPLMSFVWSSTTEGSNTLAIGSAMFFLYYASQL